MEFIGGKSGRVVFLEGEDREMMAELDIAYLFLEKFLPVPVEQELADVVKVMMTTRKMQEIANEFVERIDQIKTTEVSPEYCAFLGLVAGVHLGVGICNERFQLRRLFWPSFREFMTHYFGQKETACGGQEG